MNNTVRADISGAVPKIIVEPDAAEQNRRNKTASAKAANATQTAKLDAILANQEAILAELRSR